MHCGLIDDIFLIFPFGGDRNRKWFTVDDKRCPRWCFQFTMVEGYFKFTVTLENACATVKFFLGRYRGDVINN